MMQYASVFVWGLMVLAAFAGWGCVVVRAAGLPDPDWGLAAGWGMAVLVAVGGVLALLGLARPPVLAFLVLAGAVAFVFQTPRPWTVLGNTLAGMGPTAWGVTAAVAAALVLRYALVVKFNGVPCFDDEVAYFALVERLLQTGTLIEPFSLRRMAYGGQTFLQALVMMAGDENAGYLLDRGLGLVVTFGLVAGILGTGRPRWPLTPALALGLTMFMPFPLGNSSSHLTGFAIYLTLFRTLELAPLPASFATPRRLWMVGLVVAAAAALKTPLIVAAPVAVLAHWLPGARRGGGRAWTGLGHLGLASVAFLAPWSALLVRSSGTPFYPLFRGYHHEGFLAASLEDGPAASVLADIWAGLVAYFSHPMVVLVLSGLLVHALRRGSRESLALYVGALATTVPAVAVLANEATLELHRYLSAVTIGAFTATVAVFLRRMFDARDAEAWTNGGARRLDGMLVTAIAGLALYSAVTDAVRIVERVDERVLSAERRQAYLAMQAAVPEGAPILAVIDHGFVLDYRRNPIFNLDFPGGASPPPGMPVFEGPAALKAYLLGLGIRHIAYRNFDARWGCFYWRALWRYNLENHPNPKWRHRARLFLDMTDNVEALAGTETVVWDRNDTAVIWLR